jgi:CheY-like chemotaxis protein
MLTGDLRRQLPSEGQLLDHIELALAHTDELLESILVMSRLEAGVIVPAVSSFPVQRILNRVMQMLAPQAEQKGLKFTVVPSDVLVRSDPALLERILLNLVSNAVQYTSRGGVLVGCRLTGANVRIQVWDTGRGIAPDHHESIFQEYFRLEPRDSRRGGLGLGLAIVRSCSALLGHTVQLASIPGRGSCFTVTVKPGAVVEEAARRPPFEEEPAEDTVAAFPNLKVLLVDDDGAALQMTRSLLSRWGCVVVTAGDSREARRLMQAQSTTIDLVISDLNLGGSETGAELICSWRAELAPHLPALVMTGDTSLNTARDIRQMGLPLLYKPVRPARLSAMMARLVGTASATSVGR